MALDPRDIPGLEARVDLGKRLYGWRIKTYLCLDVFWFVGGGIAYLTTLDRLRTNEAFVHIERFLGLGTWGVIMVVLGVLAGIGVLAPYEKILRLFLVASFFVKMVFGLALFASGTNTPGAYSFMFLAGIDMLMASLQYDQDHRNKTVR